MAGGQVEGLVEGVDGAVDTDAKVPTKPEVFGSKTFDTFSEPVVGLLLNVQENDAVDAHRDLQTTPDWKILGCCPHLCMTALKARIQLAARSWGSIMLTDRGHVVPPAILN